MLPIPPLILENLRPKSVGIISDRSIDFQGTNGGEILKFSKIEAVHFKKFDLIVLDRIVESRDIANVMSECENILHKKGSVALRVDYSDRTFTTSADLAPDLSEAFPKFVFRVTGSDAEAWTLVRRREPSVILFLGPSLQGKTTISTLLVFTT